MTDALEAKTVSTNALPIIDISGLRSADAGVRAGVGRELRAACLDKGFIYLSGHGVPAALRAEVFEEVRKFFSLSVEEKMKADKAQSKANRGYEPLGGQTLEPGQPADVKEGYYVGRELPLDDPSVLAGKFNHGPNIWPEGHPSFRDVMERYYTEMLGLARLTMRGVALSLELAEDHFEEFCSEELATVRLLHYPPQPANPAPGEKGCGAHTDFGTMTFLMQDDCGGLQVWDEEAGWIHAPPIPDSYVVNLGDMMARWTNDKYHSTLHRVVNVSGRERYSVPFFYLGHPDMPVECIHTCLEDGETAKYPPTTTARHIEEMYSLTYVPANGRGG